MSDAVTEFFATRRSHPARSLVAPYPDQGELNTLLILAARVPDHGPLVPWRFVVLGDAALTRISEAIKAEGAEIGMPPEKIEKASGTYANSGCAVMVVFTPVESPKIPESEQFLTTGAVCLELVNAALARGWGASWLSGPFSHNEGFRARHLGIAEGESISGIIHLGSGKNAVPERPRPDVAAITTWVDA